MNYYTSEVLQLKTLECSSKGDKRFSAFYAKTKFVGIMDSIEMHYQLCKRFDDIESPDLRGSWKEKQEYCKKVKGKNPDFIVIANRKLDSRFLSPFYKLLWAKYFEENPELISFASEFDEFNDIFKGSALNCQADVIRQYIKEGKESVLCDCKELIDILKKKTRQ